MGFFVVTSAAFTLQAWHVISYAVSQTIFFGMVLLFVGCVLWLNRSSR
jgi:hypothetical protein